MRLAHLLRPLVFILLAFICLLLAARRAGWLSRLPPDDPSRLAPADGLLEGRVASLAVVKPRYVEFLLDAALLKNAPIRGRILVRSPARADWGARVRLSGRLELPRPPEVTGTGGYRHYLALQRVHAEFWARSLEILSPPPPLQAALARLHQRANDAFDRLDPLSSGVFKGIVLGEKVLPKEVLNDFRDAGAIYLLVTSGLHLSFVLLLGLGLSRLLGLKTLPCLLLGLLAGGLYTLVTGSGAPVARAYAMLATGTAGFLLDRESGAFQGLLTAALALLLWEPLVLFQVGFQMSFLACLGIVIALSHWKAPAGPAVARYAVSIFYVSLASQLALAPLLAVYFHKLPLASVLSNLLLAPWAEGLLAGGFALSAASILPGPWFKMLSALLIPATHGFVRTVSFFARLPGAWTWCAAPGWYALLAYYGAALALCFIPDWREARRIAVASVLLLVVALPARLAQPRPESAILMSSPGPATVLLDGPGRLVLLNAAPPGEELAHAALDRGARLEAVILTSLEPAYWRGLQALSRAVAIGRVIAPPGPQPAFDLLASGLAAQGIHVERWWPQTPLEIGGWRMTGAPGYSGHPRDDRLSLAVRGRALALDFNRVPALSRVYAAGDPSSAAAFDIMARVSAPLVAQADAGSLRVENAE